MRLLKSEIICQAVPDGFVCSVCKTKYEQEHWTEIQEALHWTMRGGFDSVFGDGTVVSIDMCQHCVKKVLGGFLEFEDDCDE